MQRFLYFAGFAFVALCGAIVVREIVTPSDGSLPAGPVQVIERAIQAPAPADPPGTPAEQWFAANKQYCNQVEVEVRTRYAPPPRTDAGSGYLAACFGLAGKIDRARQIIDSMPGQGRGAAAGVLFDVAHPVADAGDDRASGPMMELVLEYWPNNYMALYHAGMSEYSLGQSRLAKKNLRAFLALYTANDFFTQNAQKALRELTGGAQVEREPPKP